MGAAVELHRTRLDLDEVRERRLAARAELSQQGVEVVRLCPQCGTCYGDGVGVCPRDRSPLSTEFVFPLQIASRYRLERLLGRGGSGVVFAAYDLDLNRRVAVKLLAGDGRLDQ